MNTHFLSYEDCLNTLFSHFQKSGNQKIAEGMSWYMKYQFVYFGIKAPERKKIFSEYRPALLTFAKEGHLEVILLQLWEYEQREMQYCALEFMLTAKKYWTSETIDLIEKLILSKSWWDTVDNLGGKQAGMYFIKFPDHKIERINSWIESNNMWLNRSAIIHQLFYKQDTDVDLLLKCMIPHIHSKEFFHRKAIGWALRQYSRVNPRRVVEIAEKYPLSPLSKKEALRLIK